MTHGWKAMNHTVKCNAPATSLAALYCILSILSFQEEEEYIWGGRLVSSQWAQIGQHVELVKYFFKYLKYSLKISSIWQH